MTKNLKPFNLERALAGDHVITWDGKKVLQIRHFDKATDKDMKIAAISEQEGNGNYFSLHQEDGKASEHESPEFDLFMAPKTKKLWIAVNKNVTSREHDFYITSNAYLSISDLEKYSDKDAHIIEIEIEE